MILIEDIKSKISKDFFCSAELDVLLAGTNDKRYGLVKRAIAKGDLVQLRRGLYCLGIRHRRKPLDLFVLANHIYGPSYISLETALSWHGWIPEAVSVMASCTGLRQRVFANELAEFSYSTVPVSEMFADVRRVEVPFGPFFVAEPWQALMDYIYVSKKAWTGIQPLLRSLRLSEEVIEEITFDRLAPIANRYHSQRLHRFVDSIEKERG